MPEYHEKPMDAPLKEVSIGDAILFEIEIVNFNSNRYERHPRKQLLNRFRVLFVL